MTSLTIRKLDDDVKLRLRIQAARHGRSMEEEARDILRVALNTEPAQAAPAPNLAAAIRARFAPLGGVDLPLAKREAMRPPIEFEK